MQLGERAVGFQPEQRAVVVWAASPSRAVQRAIWSRHERHCWIVTVPLRDGERI